MVNWSRKAESKRSERPTIPRMAMLAFRVVEEAIQDASEQPVKRTAAHRLALAWLTLMNFAEPGEAERMWRILGHVEPYSGKHGDIRRSADAKGCLRHWRERAGI